MTKDKCFTSEDLVSHGTKCLILGIMEGCLHEKRIESSVKDDIMSGLMYSNSFASAIPDNLGEHIEDISGPIECGLDYFDRWQMYKRLFRDEKYAC